MTIIRKNNLINLDEGRTYIEVKKNKNTIPMCISLDGVRGSNVGRFMHDPYFKVYDSYVDKKATRCLRVHFKDATYTIHKHPEDGVPHWDNFNVKMLMQLCELLDSPFKNQNNTVWEEMLKDLGIMLGKYIYIPRPDYLNIENDKEAKRDNKSWIEDY